MAEFLGRLLNKIRHFGALPMMISPGFRCVCPLRLYKGSNAFYIKSVSIVEITLIFLSTAELDVPRKVQETECFIEIACSDDLKPNGICRC